MTTIDQMRQIMSSAKPNERGIYFKNEEEGQYTLEITRALYKTRGETEVEGFIFETKVLTSTNPLVQVGSPRTLTFWTRANTGWQDRFYSFLHAVFPGNPNLPVGNISAALMDDNERAKQQLLPDFMTGRTLQAFGFKKKTKKGVEILDFKYSPTTPTAETAA